MLIRLARILETLLFWLLVLAGALWSGTALVYNLTGPLRTGALVLLVLSTCGALALHLLHSRRAGWGELLLSALILGIWYQSLTPRQDRDWALDVSRGVSITQSGDAVTLTNLRDFAWTSEAQATPRWITKTCNLQRLETVDMITSVWGNPDFAHLLVSFSFADCGQVVFSVEIRREKGEAFNEIGGFFRQFEMVLIAATEDDIVKLRTNFRKEQVRLYPVTLTADQRRTLFASYVGLAQSLEASPQFYNTLTANCTTTVWALARSLKPDLPIDLRLVLSGRLPDYLTDLGVIPASPPAERDAAALITDLAQSNPTGQGFSNLIRRR